MGGTGHYLFLSQRTTARLFQRLASSGGNRSDDHPSQLDAAKLDEVALGRMLNEERPGDSAQLGRFYSAYVRATTALRALEKRYSSQSSSRTLEERANSVGLTIKAPKREHNEKN